MIARIWHGTTEKANADGYEQLVTEEVFPEIESKSGGGLKGIQLLRQEKDAEVEFTTIIWFENLETVKKFVGEDYETAYVPDKARKLLSGYDRKVTHAEMRFSSF